MEFDLLQFPRVSPASISILIVSILKRLIPLKVIQKRSV